MDLDHVVLIGLMGSGKTSIGKRVAKRLGRPLLDSDDVLMAHTGRTARELLGSDGADALHARERDVTLEALASTEPNVVAAPASAVLTMLDELKRHYVVWLCADPHWLAERVRQKSNRPFVDQDADVVVRQHEARKDLYDAVAALIVDTTRRDRDDVAAEILAALEPLLR